MTKKRVILVTGVAGYWGASVARRLSLEEDLHVIGLDKTEPNEVIEKLDFIHADIRSRLMPDLLEAEQVDSVYHLQFLEQAQINEQVFDANVMGTMNLFAACAKAGVKKIIFRSSTSVYGARPDNSAFLSEDSPLRGSRHYGYTRDLLEIEAFVNGYRRQSPEIKVVILRFANIVGPAADSPMIRFLRLQRPMVLLGFDPLIQIIHEDDVIEALVYSLRSEISGIYNIAADGPIPLSKALRIVRKLPMQIFHPLAYKGIELLKSTHLRTLDYLPIELDYLRYSWISDLRKMQDEMEFQPLYMADETLREFAGRKPLVGDDEQRSELEDDQRLQDLIERRNRVRELASGGDLLE